MGLDVVSFGKCHDQPEDAEVRLDHWFLIKSVGRLRSKDLNSHDRLPLKKEKLRQAHKMEMGKGNCSQGWTNLSIHDDAIE